MKTFLALGDSYTIGESVPLEKSWPYQLHQRLTEQGINLTEPTIVAKTGWTTDELLAAIDKREIPRGKLHDLECRPDRRRLHRAPVS